MTSHKISHTLGKSNQDDREVRRRERIPLRISRGLVSYNCQHLIELNWKCHEATIAVEAHYIVRSQR